MAVQALVALGGHAPVSRAVAWYRQVQNQDGSWSYTPGTAGDAGSTGLALSALEAAGTAPATVVKNGRSAVQGLDSFQLGCSAPAAQQGGFAYQPGKDGKQTANDARSAQARAGRRRRLPAGRRAGRVRTGEPVGEPVGECADAKASAARYLAERLSSGGSHITAALSGAAPPPRTTPAPPGPALSLADSGWSAAATGAVQWLRENGEPWIQGQTGVPLSSALALLILDARATGLNPHAFGTTDLVQQLIATGPAPASVPAPATSSPTAAAPRPRQPATRALAVVDLRRGTGRRHRRRISRQLQPGQRQTFMMIRHISVRQFLCAALVVTSLLLTVAPASAEGHGYDHGTPCAVSAYQQGSCGAVVVRAGLDRAGRGHHLRQPGVPLRRPGEPPAVQEPEDRRLDHRRGADRGARRSLVSAEPATAALTPARSPRPRRRAAPGAGTARKPQVRDRSG
ncbi:hypothetical protein GXW82_24540 [Streptacidiphilus sp. 4-A2]|nr:hypothetical protein [Streptacidiphilus sp. 4-A2]